MEYLSALWQANPYKLVLSNPRARPGDLSLTFTKIVISRREGYYLLEKQAPHRITHEKLPGDGDRLRLWIAEAFAHDFRQLDAWTTEKIYTIRESKKGKVTQTLSKNAVPPKTEHNRKKRYLLETENGHTTPSHKAANHADTAEGKRESLPIPPLIDLGILTRDGTVVAAMQHKYRQINRFLEMIADVVSREKFPRLRIIDFGCGKSYLTFVLYHFLTVIKQIPVQLLGLDWNPDVIAQCRTAAQKYGYDGLHFAVGDIAAYAQSIFSETENPTMAPGNFCNDTDMFADATGIDMVITLHACDTATDYALYHAIQLGAKIIFSVPCCQHELNAQMRGDALPLLTRYGIVQERTAALMTDAIRANLLAYSGYKTQLMEFVALSHTPKNLLIRAVRADIPPAVRRRMREEVESLNRTLGFTPLLYTLLINPSDKENARGMPKKAPDWS